MNQVDESGLAHIHQAAKKGYFSSVEKFLKASNDQLEFETQDDLHDTPLLVAVRTGMQNIDTINIIIEFGGNLEATNSQNHGVVEICCMEGHTDLLQYFDDLNRKEWSIWSRLLKFCSSELDDEAESAGRAISTLTHKVNNEVSPKWKNLLDNNGIGIFVKVIKSNIGEEAKAEILKCLINILEVTEVMEQVVNVGGVEALIKHLKSTSNTVLRLTCVCLRVLCSNKSYTELIANQGAIQSLISVTVRNNESRVLVEVVNTLGTLCADSEVRQDMFSSVQDSMQSLCHILEDCMDSDLLLALCHCLARITTHHEVNQNNFVACGGSHYLIMLTDIKNREIQLAAVDTIHMVVENNSFTQARLMEDGVVGPLINLLNKSKSQVVQEKTAGALWALAGESPEERRKMASTMGVNLLIDFLGSLSRLLHLIGCEGIGVLAQGAHNEKDAIARTSGVHPLVRLLKSEEEYLVLSAVRSLRHLCLGVGYLPHTHNQNTVSQARGVKLLVALMTLSSDDMIQVEAALTLASVALGNQSVMREIWQAGQHLEFNYTRILAHLHSENQAVRLLAGSALAAFAYNNMTEQQLIAAEGGVRFSCFLDFLQSEEEYFRCNAAFQIVVMARIIPDEEQAMASAAGIKIIVDILNTSQSLAIQALAADCIARLAHTRAGVPEAIVAIGCVERLCALMYSEQAQVRGSAAIALAYLSFNHTAERQLLNKCRCDPYLIKCLNYYTAKHKISRKFKEEWRHYKRIGGLPRIPTGRPNLVSRDYRELALAAKSRHKGASSKPPDTASVRKSDSSQELNGNSQSRASKVSTPAGNSEDVLLVAGGEVAMLTPSTSAIAVE